MKSRSARRERAASTATAPLSSMSARPAGPPPGIGMKGYTGGKNVFGLGINMTGALLGVFFFGVYFGSGWLARKTIMSENPDAERAHYFRDIKVVDTSEERR